MKKICAIIISVTMLLAAMGILTVGAEDESYTYERYDDLLADVIYQDFEDLEAMEDYATGDFAPYTIEGSGAFGFFSYCNGSSSLMVTNENPISGDQSLMIKDFLDGRKWSIDQAAPFDGDAYVVEFKIRIDAMPAGGKFAFKVSDVNSPEKDSESESGPILSFKNVERSGSIISQISLSLNWERSVFIPLPLSARRCRPTASFSWTGSMSRTAKQNSAQNLPSPPHSDSISEDQAR